MEDTLTPEEVERLAVDAGLTMKALCENARISHTTFYRWRAGKTAPSLDVYQRILDALKSARAAT